MRKTRFMFLIIPVLFNLMNKYECFGQTLSVKIQDSLRFKRVEHKNVSDTNFSIMKDGTMVMSGYSGVAGHNVISTKAIIYLNKSNARHSNNTPVSYRLEIARLDDLTFENVLISSPFKKTMLKPNIGQLISDSVDDKNLSEGEYAARWLFRVEPDGTDSIKEESKIIGGFLSRSEPNLQSWQKQVRSPRGQLEPNYSRKSNGKVIRQKHQLSLHHRKKKCLNSNYLFKKLKTAKAVKCPKF